MTRPPITTHILDLHSGTPAAAVAVTLQSPTAEVFTAATDSDGRVGKWSAPLELGQGVWTISFATQPYFDARGERSFYEDISIKFKVDSLEQHYHVPLLLSAHGYSTYRGS